MLNNLQLSVYTFCVIFSNLFTYKLTVAAGYFNAVTHLLIYDMYVGTLENSFLKPVKQLHAVAGKLYVNWKLPLELILSQCF